MAAVAVFTLLQGASVLSFGLLELGQSRDAGAEAARALADRAPVSVLARRALTREYAAGDPRALAADLEALLMEAPMSSDAWLDLAAARRNAGSDIEPVTSALAMSHVTGPNESYLMAARAQFAMPMWAALPRELRRDAMLDLVGGWDDIRTTQRMAMKAVLSLAPDATRTQIGAALFQAGATEVAETLGLATEPAGSGNGVRRRDARPARQGE